MDTQDWNYKNKDEEKNETSIDLFLEDIYFFLNDITVILKMLMTILLVISLVLWSTNHFNSATTKESDKVAFSFAVPAYNVIFIGQLLLLFLGERVSRNLALTYEVPGLFLFFYVSVKQLLCCYNFNFGIISYAMAFVDLAIGILMLIDAFMEFKISDEMSEGEEMV